jgi:hypothetical protein
MVHLALITGFIGAVASAITLSRKYLGHSGTTDHAIIGLLVLAIVMVHLTQRRHTVKRLLAHLLSPTSSSSQHPYQAHSDTILWILTLNAVVSGVVDFLMGHMILLPIPGPFILQKWHALSSLILLAYVIVHVVRRRKRLWSSHIR